LSVSGFCPHTFSKPKPDLTAALEDGNGAGGLITITIHFFDSLDRHSFECRLFVCHIGERSRSVSPFAESLGEK
jgi:hypothetical protein